MFSIEMPTVEGILASTMESGIGLDLSKLSTGITVYENGKTDTHQLVMEYDEDSPYWRHLLMEELRNDLITLFKGKHYDIIAIEDTIGSVNYETAIRLVLLNSVIDRLIYEGTITCNTFMRENNSTWKKWLRTLKPGKKYETDKVEIESILKYLGYSLVDEYAHLSNSKKKEFGYQDRLDSTGLLIGAGLRRKNEVNNPTTKTKRRKQLKLQVESYVSEGDLFKIHPEETLTPFNLNGNLLAQAKKFFKNLTEEEKGKKFYMVKDTLGTLGIEYGISDNSNGLNYIVMYQK